MPRRRQEGACTSTLNTRVVDRAFGASRLAGLSKTEGTNVAATASEGFLFYDVVDRPALEELASKLTTRQPAHLLVRCSIGDVADVLLRLADQDKTYALYVHDLDEAAREHAESVDTVPLFVAKDADEARSIAARLVDNPYEVVLNAVNGEAVSIRYLSGNPT